MNIMEKKVMSLLLLGILLVSHLVLAQEQTQTYSGFDRFVDNVKMFFSFGDKKVMLALDIREKELDSAIINTKNGEDEEAEKNLERAKERLQFVQNKVSKDIAEDVKTNIDEIISKINEEENLPDNFGTHMLEEEKTQLTAELVIEVEGKEGQTLTRKIVKDTETGENKVKVVVEGEKKGENIIEIEEKIVEIEEKIVKKEVEKIIDIGENKIESGTNIIESGSEIDGGGDIDDTTPKTPPGNIVDDDVAPGPQGIVGEPSYSDDEGHHGDIPEDNSRASGVIDED